MYVYVCVDLFVYGCGMSRCMRLLRVRVYDAA